MVSVVAIMIVFLIIGIVVDSLFGIANKSIRRRWGIEQALLPPDPPPLHSAWRSLTRHAVATTPRSLVLR